jgi:hypothetical protein
MNLPSKPSPNQVISYSFLGGLFSLSFSIMWCTRIWSRMIEFGTIFYGLLDCAFGGSRLRMRRPTMWIVVVGIATLFATTCFQVFVKSSCL